MSPSFSVNPGLAVSALRLAVWSAVAVLASTPCVAFPAGFGANSAPPSLLASQDSMTPQALVQANVALQAGEADKALALLRSLPASGDGAALARNLTCRVKFALGEWDAAISECQQAVRLNGQSSDFHLWLARALGEKAANASFLSAFSLAKQSRSEFEESVRLNPRNAAALADLGDFYSEAPGAVGGGVDKAQQIAAQLGKVDPAKANHLRGKIAEQQKDYASAEQAFKQAIAASNHPALEWTSLASFYSRRKRYSEMESAIQSALGAAQHDKYAAVAYYDGAGVLMHAKRDPAEAATLLGDYLASSNKSEEAPAFVAHLRLARVKAALGDAAAASRERSAALALASEYKPARDFNPTNTTGQETGL